MQRVRGMFHIYKDRIHESTERHNERFESIYSLRVLRVASFTSPREESELNARSIVKLPWKPAVQRGWPADQVEVVGFVDSQSFMDVTVRVDVRSHGAVQRQAARRGEAGLQLKVQLKNKTAESTF